MDATPAGGMNPLYARSSSGVVTTPNALASGVGADILGRGGNAVEAAIAIAAAIAVVYPHMNSLGGDAFWLIADGDGEVRGLAGAGAAGAAYTPQHYADAGLAAMPERGGMAAVTVAGAVGSWAAAYEMSRDTWGGRLAWAEILAPARRYAEEGFPVSRSHAATLAERIDGLRDLPGFAEVFLAHGGVPGEGETMTQPALARTLAELQETGAEGFYRGALARRLVAGLRAAGSLLSEDDLAAYRPEWVEPLRMAYGAGELVNLPPPTQGVASLMLLGLLERAGVASMDPEGDAYVHHAIEATKRAFALRDRYVGDPRFVDVPLAAMLDADALDRLAATIDPQRAAPSPVVPGPGDTVWFGVVDAKGRSVSMIQSIYHEFGCGVVAGETGVVWNNRGCSFSLTPGHANVLAPGKRPFHTLNPALYVENGRVRLVYGTMGGDGQPQTQAAILTRALNFDYAPDAAVAAPRWLFGRTWGETSAGVRLERRFAPEVMVGLQRRGHLDLSWAPRFADIMGHAGMIRIGRRDGGLDLEAGADPRSDGAARAAGV
ncbi:gamma-glutamyltransferase [Acidihalobacter prosperus]|uniref:Glutathione hydrolase proenzyme n=1 Tax=Acidihalobacter prosperus TaxID=160660 RepID=A0A1A6C517_9GAMM|nr:gamma-glutamyltransferase [Acidihalobacter prosperus]OBS09653.1 gamma-glutamyltransferase [Acidihalobacter prosperus]